MADIYDRIFGGNPANEAPPLNVHNLTAALTLVQCGNFTATQVKNHFNMDTAAQGNFDGLVTLITNASTVADKAIFISKLEAVSIATESGIYTTKAAFKDALGI